jgi:uncharacterized protein YegJ (DUF2314 family)
MPRFPAAAAMALLGCVPMGAVLAQSINDKVANDEVSMVQEDDAAMLKAFAKARATLDAFLAQVDSKDAALESPALKVKVEHRGNVEYFWVTQFARSGKGFVGYLANEPRLVSNVRFGQRYKFSREDIYDWTYVDAATGALKGNFTACALLVHETPEAARQFKEENQLECAD